MSKYTTELRYICETEAGLKVSRGYNDINSIIAIAREKIFNFEYPLFDEAYRESFEIKILRHFYTREIGLETYGLWKLKLQTLLCDIMPYYNQLYNSAKLQFNPFYDVDYVKEHEGSNDYKRDNSENKNDILEQNVTTNVTNDLHTITDGNTTSNNTNKYSDTPQGNITGMISDTNMYLTNATIDNGGTTAYSKVDNIGNSTTTVTGNITDTAVNNTEENGVANDRYLESIKGKIGTESYSSLLKKYRETFLNIDLMVIEKLEDLFIQLW